MFISHNETQRSACPAAKPRGTAGYSSRAAQGQTEAQRMSRGEAAGHSGTRRNPAPKANQNAAHVPRRSRGAQRGTAAAPPKDKPKRSACPAAKPRGTAGHSKPPAPPKKTKPQPSAAVAVLRRRNKRSGTNVPRHRRGIQRGAVGPAQKTKPQPSAAVAVLRRRNKRSGTNVPRQSRGTQWSAVCSDVVRAWGLEPQRIAAREPKSRMSANSIMPAYSAGLAFSRGGAAAPAWIIILPAGGGVNLGVDFGGAVD